MEAVRWNKGPMRQIASLLDFHPIKVAVRDTWHSKIEATTACNTLHVMGRHFMGVAGARCKGCDHTSRWQSVSFQLCAAESANQHVIRHMTDQVGSSHRAGGTRAVTNIQSSIQHAAHNMQGFTLRS